MLICGYLLNLFNHNAKNKSSTDNLSTKIMLEAIEAICPYLTECINAAMDTFVFPNKFKESNVCAIYKNWEPISKREVRTDKYSISHVYNISTNCERTNKPVYDWYASPMPFGFRHGNSKQHALFEYQRYGWKNYLNISDIGSTILMGL